MSSKLDDAIFTSFKNEINEKNFIAKERAVQEKDK